MSRFKCIALAVLLAVTLSGCDREATYRDRPLSYWIDASRSANLQTKQQAIAALMTFAQDPKATVRLAEIRSETLARRNENWTQLVAWLQNSVTTREHRVTITSYLDNMPDNEDRHRPIQRNSFSGEVARGERDPLETIRTDRRSGSRTLSSPYASSLSSVDRCQEKEPASRRHSGYRLYRRSICNILRLLMRCSRLKLQLYFFSVTLRFFERVEQFPIDKVAGRISYAHPR